MITVKTTITLVALGVLCVMNVLSFSLMGADKRRAAAGKWRISEKALFLAAALFVGFALMDSNQYQSTIIWDPNSPPPRFLSSFVSRRSLQHMDSASSGDRSELM